MGGSLRALSTADPSDNGTTLRLTFPVAGLTEGDQS